MSDVLFVVKCFFAAVGIAFLMQMKVSGMTLESRVDTYIHKSALAIHLQDAAAGGARLLQETYSSVKNFVMDSTSSFRQSESKGNH